MSLDLYAPREEYLGAGNLAQYPYDFYVTDATQLRVVVYDLTNTLVHNVRGDDTTYLSSVALNTNNFGGVVNLLANLTTGYRIIILQANDAPTQPSQFRTKGSFTLAMVESALDFLGSAVQRLAYRGTRSVQLSDADDPVTFNPQLPSNIATASTAGLIPSTNAAGTGWNLVSMWTPVTDLVAAIAAAAAAAISEANAAASAAIASGAQTSASTSATQAATSATNAAGSATSAATSATAASGSAAAASTSATNAAGSATSAATSATAAAASAAAAAVSATNSATSATSSATSATASATSATNSAASAAAAAASAVAAALFNPTIVGSRAAPSLILAAGGIAFSGASIFNTWFIAGNTTPVTVTANPQVAAATTVGQRLTLRGRSATNTVTLQDGTGLSLNGMWVGGLDDNLDLEFDGTNWVEMGRS